MSDAGVMTESQKSEMPFKGDATRSRELLAEKLTHYVQCLKKGHTIAIDAEWGNGKTWFGKEWEKHLIAEGHKTIWLDAFAVDFVDDPFMAIAQQIVSAIESANEEDANDIKRLKRTVGKIGKHLIPGVAKAITHAAINLTLGKVASEEVGKILDGSFEDADDAIGTLVKNQLDAVKSQKESVFELKKQLESFSTKLNKPLVFFVDELDRCRPDFAVKTIERIKHLFEIDNIVFVLLLNRRQLEAAIKGLYGSDFDAQTYLQKFVHINFTLPAPQPNTDRGRNTIISLSEHFIQKAKERLNLTMHEDISNFVEAMARVGLCLGLTFRDIERAIDVFILLERTIECQQLPSVAAFLIALKVKHPNVFNGIKTRDFEAVSFAKELHQKTANFSDVYDEIETYLLSYGFLDPAARVTTAQSNERAQSLRLGYQTSRAVTQQIINTLDLPMLG